MRLALLAYDGCLTSVVSGLVDAFALASVASHRLQPSAPVTFETVIATPDGATINGSGGFQIRAQTSLAQLSGCDVAVVPPMRGPDIDLVLAKEPMLVRWLLEGPQRPPILCSVCTGAFFLAEAGLLAGLRATTNAWYGDLLQTRFPTVQVRTEERLIDERSIISAGTTTAFLDLSIYLVDKFAGHDVAVWTAKALSRDKNYESQQPYFLFVGPRDHGDDDVLRIQEHLEQHYAQPLDAQQLSDEAAMSVRTFTRRFQKATGLAPMTYLRRLRIEAAKRLLETQRSKVETISADVGYEDTRSFVRAFRAATGVAPNEYRLKFRRR